MVKMRSMSNPTTLVVQSYRTDNVSPWIQTCLASVATWSENNGYSYECLDDSFFAYAPEWVNTHCGDQLLPITDVARLYLIRKRLENYPRVIWIDADMLIFTPKYVQPDQAKGYALAREIWVNRDATGRTVVREKVNNSCIVMTRQHPILDFLIFATEEVIRNHKPGKVDFLAAGTTLLTRLATAVPIRILPSIATFSPLIVSEINSGNHKMLPHLLQRHKTPLGAANLCGSLVDKQLGNVCVDEADLMQTVRLLLDSKGSVLDGKPA